MEHNRHQDDEQHVDHVQRVVHDIWGGWENFERAVRQEVTDAQRDGRPVDGRQFTQQFLSAYPQLAKTEYVYAMIAMQKIKDRLVQESIERTGTPELNVHRLPDGPLSPDPGIAQDGVAYSGDTAEKAQWAHDHAKASEGTRHSAQKRLADNRDIRRGAYINELRIMPRNKDA